MLLNYTLEVSLELYHTYFSQFLVSTGATNIQFFGHMP
jgi:hypothetical protein